MKTLNTIFFALILVVSFSSVAQAAGDYVWEGKFKEELPKAEQGDEKSQYAVGEMYEKGKGAVKDVQKAFEWYSKSAAQDNSKAAYKVGLAYLEGAGVNKNYKEAYKWLKKSADKDYVRAQYYLGEMFENGQGVDKDFDQAIKWYKLALAGGYGSASEGIQRVSRAQSAADAARIVATKPTPRPTPRPAPTPTPKAASKPDTTKEKLMAGGWKHGNISAEYLPSSVAQCTDTGQRVECLSVDLQRNIGMADINYTTKAILFSFSPDGSFKVSYRNNVTKITITDPAFAESGGKVPVTLGWQEAEHKLVCEFENDRSLACTKNKSRKVLFHR